jgi:hypothetical protein
MVLKLDHMEKELQKLRSISHHQPKIKRFEDAVALVKVQNRSMKQELSRMCREFVKSILENAFKVFISHSVI